MSAKRKAESLLDDEKSAKRARVEEKDDSKLHDFSKKDMTYKVTFVDLVFTSSDEIKFYFNKALIKLSDIVALKVSLQEEKDGHTEIPLQVPSSVVNVVLNVIHRLSQWDEKEKNSIRQIVSSDENLAGIMRFAFQYDSRALTKICTDAIESRPFPWNLAKYESWFNECKIPVDLLAQTWVQKVQRAENPGADSKEEPSEKFWKACLDAAAKISNRRDIVSPHIIHNVLTRCPEKIHEHMAARQILLSILEELESYHNGPKNMIKEVLKAQRTGLIPWITRHIAEKCLEEHYPECLEE